MSNTVFQCKVVLSQIDYQCGKGQGNGKYCQSQIKILNDSTIKLLLKVLPNYNPLIYLNDNTALYDISLHLSHSLGLFDFPTLFPTR